MEGDVRPDLNNRDGDILCIEASLKYEEWFGIREIGLKIQRKVQDLDIRKHLVQWICKKASKACLNFFGTHSYHALTLQT